MATVNGKIWNEIFQFYLFQTLCTSVRRYYRYVQSSIRFASLKILVVVVVNLQMPARYCSTEQGMEQ